MLIKYPLLIPTFGHGATSLIVSPYATLASNLLSGLCIYYCSYFQRVTLLLMFSIYHIADDFVPSVETTFIREQMQVDVRGMIEKLPPEQREVIFLRQYADKSFKEIAEIRKESVNTSLGRMRYALNNLRKMIKHG
jgi:DNA-directed RNA polymerase specialized sigma24 family protein